MVETSTIHYNTRRLVGFFVKNDSNTYGLVKIITVLFVDHQLFELDFLLLDLKHLSR